MLFFYLKFSFIKGRFSFFFRSAFLFSAEKLNKEDPMRALRRAEGKYYNNILLILEISNPQSLRDKVIYISSNIDNKTLLPIFLKDIIVANDISRKKNYNLR